MAASDTRYFDLNIEQFLESWGPAQAVREIIANALDEQALTRSEDIRILQDRAGTWVIRDFGRGLRVEHLTQNESSEKLENADRVIGRFGVGLKDALATLRRHHVTVQVTSRHGDISLSERSKHGFDNVTTLHAVVGPPVDYQFAGTRFRLTSVRDEDVEAAKGYFLRFTGDVVLATTAFGQVVETPPSRPSRVYVNGMMVAEEERFLFSYNITSLTVAMRKALNRERTNVGRAAYAERVRAILLASRVPGVARRLGADLARLSHGTSGDEVRWPEVAVHACKILNAAGGVIFASPTEQEDARQTVDQARTDGLDLVTIPEDVRERLDAIRDYAGSAVRTVHEYQAERSAGFEFEFIDAADLGEAERAVFARTGKIVEIAGGLPQEVGAICIAAAMRPQVGNGPEPTGSWEARTGVLVVRRDQLATLRGYAGALVRTLVQARTGHEPATRDLEDALADVIGQIIERGFSGRGRN